MTGAIDHDLGGQISHTPPIARTKRAATLVCLISLFFLPHHPPASAVRYYFSHLGHLNCCPSPL